MPDPVSFSEILDAIGQFPVEDQETLIEFVRRRLAEEDRKRVIADVREANREYEQGQCRTMTVDDLMGELHSGDDQSRLGPGLSG